MSRFTHSILLTLAAVLGARSAAAQIPNATLFFGEHTFTTPVSLGSVSFTGLDPSNVLSTGQGNPPAVWGMASDPANGFLYYCRGDAEGGIVRSHFNGHERQRILAGDVNFVMPRGVALDSVNQRLYFISPGNANRIGSCALDGSDVQILLQYNDMQPPVAPRSIHVDPVAQKIYWWNAGGGFRSANLDGTQAQDELVITASVSSWVTDVANGFFYWVQNANICRAPIDGSSPPQVILIDPDFPDTHCLAVLPELDLLVWVAVADTIRWTSLSSPGVVGESAHIANISSIRTIEVMAGPRVVVAASPTTLQAGDVVTIDVCGGKPASAVGLFLRDPVTGITSRLVHSTLGRSGRYGTQWTVPAGTPPGVLEIVAETLDPASQLVTTLPATLQIQ